MYVDIVISNIFYLNKHFFFFSFFFMIRTRRGENYKLSATVNYTTV